MSRGADVLQQLREEIELQDTDVFAASRQLPKAVSPRLNLDQPPVRTYPVVHGN